VPAPVDVLVTFRTGAQQLQLWDGRDSSLELKFPSANPIVRVELDPHSKLKAELNRLDNSMGTWRMRLPLWAA
jgi:hypothetical protein